MRIAGRAITKERVKGEVTSYSNRNIYRLSLWKGKANKSLLMKLGWENEVLTFGKVSWDRVRNSLSLYFGLSNNVCLLDWSTCRVELRYFLLFGLMTLLTHLPLGCIFRSDASPAPEIQTFLLPAMKSWLTVLGSWTTRAYWDCHKAALPSPFRPLLVTCLTMPIPRVQLSGIYQCFSELVTCHCVTEGWLLSHGTYARHLCLH